MHCHMVYLPMIPNKKQLLEFYATYASYKEFPSPPSLFRRVFSGKRSRDPHIGILESTGGVQGRRICDIGCSYGHFLEQCRHEGASVFGIEWDEQATEYLATRKIAVERELPDQATFDVICAFQLIEHLEEPKNLIGKAASLLESDGRLLLSFPNGGEIGTIGPAWLGFRVDQEHLNYFSLSSISTLLQDQGLYIEHYWEYAQPCVSRQQKNSVSSKVLAKLTNMKKLYSKFTNSKNSCGVPTYSDGKFVLTVLARKP